jgi:hypothetical protein
MKPELAKECDRLTAEYQRTYRLTVYTSPLVPRSYALMGFWSTSTGNGARVTVIHPDQEADFREAQEFMEEEFTWMGPVPDSEIVAVLTGRRPS